jgi:hypothetical protein
MSNEDLAQEVERARRDVFAWLATESPGQQLTDAQLVHATAGWASREYGLQLRTRLEDKTSENQESKFVAYWVHGEAVANWFDRPFAASSVEQSKLLACGAVLKLLNTVGAT